MKKLYRKAVVHPTPPLISDHLLYLLPATLLALTAALSSQDREVLAYLISSCSNYHRKTTKTTLDHTPCFDCYCFRCYTSYWVKWDSSPNRELIHHIIDDFENQNTTKDNNNNNKAGVGGGGKKKKKNTNKGNKEKKIVVSSVELDDQVKKCSEAIVEEEDTSVVFVTRDEALEANITNNNVMEEEMEMEMEMEKGGSIRRFVTFIGEKFWGVWA